MQLPAPTLAQVEAAIGGLEQRGESIWRHLGGFDGNAKPPVPKHVAEAQRAWAAKWGNDAYETAVLLAALRAWARDLGDENRKSW
jgi:hypothetical protein